MSDSSNIFTSKKGIHAVMTALVLLAVSCKHEKAYFAQLASTETGINFINRVNETDSFNIFSYPYLLNGAGVGIADFNHDGLEDIFFTGNHKASNKLYINKGNFKFEDITETAGLKGKSDWSNGVAIVDINADGWADIYISTVTIPGKLASANELYINNKNGQFTEAAAQYGLNFSGHGTQTIFFDYDRDGDLDCYFLNHAIAYEDDYQDIRARTSVDSQSGHKLYRNDNNYFVDVTVAAGIYSSSVSYGLGIAAGDINGDGWQDLYVSNDFKENDYCYINNGNGTFTESSKKLFGHTSRFSMGNDMADFDNDGWLDIMTLDMLSQDEKVIKASVADDDIEVYNYKQHFGFHYQFAKNCLQRNVGGKYFQDLALQMGVAATDWSWSPLFADFNNDGRKDLFVSNGYKYRLNDLDFNSFIQNTAINNRRMNIATNKFALLNEIPKGRVHDYFFLANSIGGFDEVSSEAGFIKETLSNGAAYADLDNDGDLDLVVNRLENEAGIYRNDLPKANYLKIELKGEGHNSIGIGAAVFIFSGVNMQLYHQSPVRGFMSSVSPLLLAGLGNSNSVDSLLVIWPDGKEEAIHEPAINKTISIYQKNASLKKERSFPKNPLASYFVNITGSASLGMVHEEDEFNDLNVNPFLPHSIATQGPRLAIADVNNDGLQDIYACAAKGKAAFLLLQDKNSKFSISYQPAFANDSLFEDTDALFFDADKDGDADLYVVSGGNELYGRQEYLKDRLYLNDGKGNFLRKAGIPDLFENKSGVRACDFDKDGDLDLFVGGRVNARMYGYTPSSVILENDGKSNFKENTQLIAPGLSNIGMVTDACWTDIDKDGWTDLLLVGEWMPVTVFKNQKGKLKRESLPTLAFSAGWWNTIYTTDVDSDGDDDYLLGNWGTNSKLQANQQYPLRMYIADWDGNGDTDPVLAIHKGNQYYPFFGKSDLERRVPALKKKFLKYTAIAGKNVEEVFGEENIRAAQKLEAYTMESSLLLNENGSLTLSPMPAFLQTAPLFSFASFTRGGIKYFIAGGNFYEVAPFEGRYDAMLPPVFHFENKKIVFDFFLDQPGCVRDLELLKLANSKEALLLGKNNGRMEALLSTK